MRLCDREGCEEPGDRPAPKSPNSPERWMFCERHAAEYNRGWNYFEGLSAEDVGAVVGLTANAVRVTQHRALARLRRFVAESADHRERFADRWPTSVAA